MSLLGSGWALITRLIKAEDQLTRQHDIIKAQQAKIESLNEWVVRLETTVELLLRAAGQKRLDNN